jgi:hypothetical protein
MHVCYIDESGTSDIPGTTSHFVLAGISIPIRHWRAFCVLLKRYGLGDAEFHTAWILRKYLTSMVQIADLCAYSLRRYLENNEKDLFQLIFERADKIKAHNTVVGVRHFAALGCDCDICQAHKGVSPAIPVKLGVAESKS